MSMKVRSSLKLACLPALIAAGFSTAATADLTVEPRGRLHLDGGFYDEDVSAFGDGINVRRGRLGLEGTLDDTWSFVIEYDWAEGGDASPADVKLTRKLAGGTLTLGHVRVPFSHNLLTSANNITFMERSSPVTALSIDRMVGARYDFTTGDITSQSMLHGRTMDSGAVGGADETYGAAQRLVFHPKINDMLVHVGGAVSYQNLGDFNDARFRERMEIRIDPDVRLIDTGALADVKSLLRVGLEFAVQQGPFSAEAEYITADTESNLGPDYSFNGYHVQASYVLTGESRSYKGGGFGGIKPKSDAGAYEVAARFSQTDLNDQGIVGGEQQAITLGLNYYASANVRFMSNIVLADIEGANGVDEKPKAIAFRLQYAF